MNIEIWLWIKLTGGILLVYFALFFLFLLFVMGDEGPTEFSIKAGTMVQFILVKILGFPLNLINRNYPFYLKDDSERLRRRKPIILSLLNAGIQATLIYIILWLLI